ncbi:unnamed protein product [Linum trigynum]|uniref:Uncharacterized protein n=1 Tax=Linum trigynum TaxID=586398 RepID=A0AAV2G838_9ROSI
MLRTVEGSGWSRAVVGWSRAACNDGGEQKLATGDGAACGGDCELLAPGSGEQKRRWRLARATGDGALLAATGRKRWGPGAMVDGGRVAPLSLCRLLSKN